MSIQGILDNLLKNMKEVDMPELLRVVAPKLFKARSRRVLPWSVGGAIVGFAAGVVLGPKLIAAGKSLTVNTGTTLVRWAGAADRALKEAVKGASEDAAHNTDQDSERRSPVRSMGS